MEPELFSGHPESDGLFIMISMKYLNCNYNLI